MKKKNGKAVTIPKNEKIIDLSETLIINLSKVMNSLGEYLIDIGNIEENNPEFKEFMDKFQKDPGEFEDFLEKLPSEVANEMLNLLLRMVMLQQKTTNIDKLDAKEKINVGKNMKSISESLEKLKEKLKDE